MAETKIYFYMRLSEHFWDSDAMIAIENQRDGFAMANLLLKMYCRSLRNDGKLVCSEKIPYRALKTKIFKGQFTEDLEQIYDAEGSPFLGTRRGMARPVFLRFPRLHFGGGTRFENGKIRSL